jgi:hypothetical protein
MSARSASAAWVIVGASGVSEREALSARATRRCTTHCVCRSLGRGSDRVEDAVVSWSGLRKHQPFNFKTSFRKIGVRRSRADKLSCLRTPLRTDPSRDGLPDWLPELAVTYLAHTCGGHAIRAIARAKGCHASTVLRQVRKVEAWRDDPLVDEALEEMSRVYAAAGPNGLRISRRSLPPCRSTPIPRCRSGAALPPPSRRARCGAHRAGGPPHPAPALREGRVPRCRAEHGEGGGAARGGSGQAEPDRGRRPRRGARLRAPGMDRLRARRQDRRLHHHPRRACGAEAAADRGAARARAPGGLRRGRHPLRRAAPLLRRALA